MTTMGEYEDRYPEAYGQSEETESEAAQRRVRGLGLPRQVRDSDPVGDTADRCPAHAAGNL
jgi:hypothetical protein